MFRSTRHKERRYNADAPLFARVTFRWRGTTYSPGQKLPTDMPEPKRRQLWRIGKADHELRRSMRTRVDKMLALSDAELERLTAPTPAQVEPAEPAPLPPPPVAEHDLEHELELEHEHEQTDEIERLTAPNADAAILPHPAPLSEVAVENIAAVEAKRRKRR